MAQQVSIVNELTSSLRHKPAQVSVDKGVVDIQWSDGHRTELDFRKLRQACPCALCVDEVTGEPRLDPETVPKDVHPVDVKTVGRYALQFHWSDGHGTGLYTFDNLRSLDPSAPVAAARG